tara:strand:+ start:517 stop:1020 length:504 start_codon:yes stop_codon:yes gene_type:complete
MKKEMPSFKTYYEVVNSGDPELIEEIAPLLAAAGGHAARGALAAGKVAVGVGAGAARKMAAKTAGKVVDAGKGLVGSVGKAVGNQVTNVVDAGKNLAAVGDDPLSQPDPTNPGVAQVPVAAVEEVPTVPLNVAKKQMVPAIEAILTNAGKNREPILQAMRAHISTIK